MDEIHTGETARISSTMSTRQGDITLIVDACGEARARAVFVLCKASLDRTIHHFLQPDSETPD